MVQDTCVNTVIVGEGKVEVLLDNHFLEPAEVEE